MFEPLLARISAAPVLIGQGQDMVFVTGLQQMFEQYSAFSPEQRREMADAGYDEDFWPDEDSWMSHHRPYRVRDGILVIPVSGSLINEFGWVFEGWVTGYTYIWKAFERGLADPEVQGIVFKVNSPGGEVSGNFDLVDYLASNRTKKPTLAVAADHAYSAAYNIASIASEVKVSRVGGVGSIGVVTMHIDMSKYMEKLGIGVTFVHAGKHKVDGNPYQPLPDDVKKRMQARIDALYSIFISSVARNRDMDEQAVRDTEALTYGAEEAIKVGLADAVASFDDAMTAFAGKLAPNDGAFQMSKDNGNAPAATSEATQAQLDEQRQAGFDAGKAEGVAEGQKAERERIAAIMGSDEAKNRPASAFNLALKTGLTVDEAKEFLAAQPEEVAKDAADMSAFERAMATDNPEILGNTVASEQDDDPAAAILGDYRAAGGQVENKD